MAAKGRLLEFSISAAAEASVSKNRFYSTWAWLSCVSSMETSVAGKDCWPATPCSLDGVGLRPKMPLDVLSLELCLDSLQQKQLGTCSARLLPCVEVKYFDLTLLKSQRC